MRLSLNEIEGGCLKAARGAGLSHSLAQEAGLAARWLALRGLPWCAPLLAALKSFEAQQQEPVDLEREGEAAHLTGGPSALLLGPAASDVWRAGLTGGRDLLIEGADQPLLCLALLVLAAEEDAVPLQVQWDGGALAFAPGLCRFLGANPAPRARLQLSPSDTAKADAGRDLLAEASGCLDRGCAVELECWAALEGYAKRVLVPESAASREGAGAGSIDND